MSNENKEQKNNEPHASSTLIIKNNEKALKLNIESKET